MDGSSRGHRWDLGGPGSELHVAGGLSYVIEDYHSTKILSADGAVGWGNDWLTCCGGLGVKTDQVNGRWTLYRCGGALIDRGLAARWAAERQAWIGRERRRCRRRTRRCERRSMPRAFSPARRLNGSANTSNGTAEEVGWTTDGSATSKSADRQGAIRECDRCVVNLRLKGRHLWHKTTAEAVAVMFVLQGGTLESS